VRTSPYLDPRSPCLLGGRRFVHVKFYILALDFEEVTEEHQAFLAGTFGLWGFVAAFLRSSVRRVCLG
jgi:hypothetical protein